MRRPSTAASVFSWSRTSAQAVLRNLINTISSVLIDVLDAGLFHSTYFANRELVGDGSGSGKMTMEKLSGVLQCIQANSDVVGLTVAEYLPFDEHNLSRMFSKIGILTG